MTKKSYIIPQLTVHGDVENITLAGALQNSDVPQGTPNTAFPVVVVS